MGDVELELIIKACRSTFATFKPLADFPGPGVRWDRVVTLSRRHRVQGLVWDGLQHLSDQVPGDFAQILLSDAEEVIGANLRIAAESARLAALFHAAGLDLLFLKGLALGALAYRNPYLKMGWDIDLLVSPTQLDRAGQLLRTAGYIPAIPGNANGQKLAKWHANRKESVWRTPSGAFYIDLHTRLADNPAMLANIGMASPRQSAKLGEIANLPTLGTAELFAYLAVHGASSAWFRLKWAADLAAFLSTKTHMEIEGLYDHSQQMGAGRAAAQALLLIDDLFEIGMDSRFRLELESDPINRWLVRCALRQLSVATEPVGRPLGTLMIHLTQLAMMPGARFATSELLRQLRDAASDRSADDEVTCRT